VDFNELIKVTSKAQVDGFLKGQKLVKRIEVEDESEGSIFITVIKGDKAIVTKVENE
jgi:hypothetical protein